ncbi:uncharacterized protein LOC129757024 isoform X2 [Uranotaenia lowii]|uniref:uncharacterized protein LOC129757024 isoform X2 n=1 Tax=Uranotaenia lowii TaxID=190385 RepID=UPI00247AEBF0|nr:uncharacterized protein LOC129757024 isoform X2 [Uranotaenia lowii]
MAHNFVKKCEEYLLNIPTGHHQKPQPKPRKPSSPTAGPLSSTSIVGQRKSVGFGRGGGGGDTSSGENPSSGQTTSGRPQAALNRPATAAASGNRRRLESSSLTTASNPRKVASAIREKVPPINNHQQHQAVRPPTPRTIARAIASSRSSAIAQSNPTLGPAVNPGSRTRISNQQQQQQQQQPRQSNTKFIRICCRQKLVVDGANPSQAAAAAARDAMKKRDPFRPQSLQFPAKCVGTAVGGSQVEEGGGDDGKSFGTLRDPGKRHEPSDNVNQNDNNVLALVEEEEDDYEEELEEEVENPPNKNSFNNQDESDGDCQEQQQQQRLEDDGQPRLNGGTGTVEGFGPKRGGSREQRGQKHLPNQKKNDPGIRRAAAEGGIETWGGILTTGKASGCSPAKTTATTKVQMKSKEMEEHRKGTTTVSLINQQQRGFAISSSSSSISSCSSSRPVSSIAAVPPQPRPSLPEATNPTSAPVRPTGNDGSSSSSMLLLEAQQKAAREQRRANLFRFDPLRTLQFLTLELKSKLKEFSGTANKHLYQISKEQLLAVKVLTEYVQDMQNHLSTCEANAEKKSETKTHKKSGSSSLSNASEECTSCSELRIALNQEHDRNSVQSQSQLDEINHLKDQLDQVQQKLTASTESLPQQLQLLEQEHRQEINQMQVTLAAQKMADSTAIEDLNRKLSDADIRFRQTEQARQEIEGRLLHATLENERLQFLLSSQTSTMTNLRSDFNAIQTLANRQIDLLDKTAAVPGNDGGGGGGKRRGLAKAVAVLNQQQNNHNCCNNNNNDGGDAGGKCSCQDNHHRNYRHPFADSSPPSTGMEPEKPASSRAVNHHQNQHQRRGGRSEEKTRKLRHHYAFKNVAEKESDDGNDANELNLPPPSSSLQPPPIQPEFRTSGGSPQLFPSSPSSADGIPPVTNVRNGREKSYSNRTSSWTSSFNAAAELFTSAFQHHQFPGPEAGNHLVRLPQQQQHHRSVAPNSHNNGDRDNYHRDDVPIGEEHGGRRVRLVTTTSSSSSISSIVTSSLPLSTASCPSSSLASGRFDSVKRKLLIDSDCESQKSPDEAREPNLCRKNGASFRNDGSKNGNQQSFSGISTAATGRDVNSWEQQNKFWVKGTVSETTLFRNGEAPDQAENPKNRNPITGVPVDVVNDGHYRDEQQRQQQEGEQLHHRHQWKQIPNNNNNNDGKTNDCASSSSSSLGRKWPNQPGLMLPVTSMAAKISTTTPSEEEPEGATTTILAAAKGHQSSDAWPSSVETLQEHQHQKQQDQDQDLDQQQQRQRKDREKYPRDYGDKFDRQRETPPLRAPAEAAAEKKLYQNRPIIGQIRRATTTMTDDGGAEGELKKGNRAAFNDLSERQGPGLVGSNSGSNNEPKSALGSEQATGQGRQRPSSTTKEEEALCIDFEDL